MRLPQYFYANRKLDQLVENKTSFTLDKVELNIYETYHFAEKVMLQFSQPVLASMLEGKKVMHLDGRESFNFLPGESLILPSDEMMCIDFPEAKNNNPTRCLAMQIDQQLIESVVSEMNDRMPRVDDLLWSHKDTNFSFTNDAAIHQLLQRLIFVFMEDHPSKDMFIQLMLKELIIRIAQTENKTSYHNNLLNICDNNRLAFVIKYIKDHLYEELCVKKLADKANMSESNFHRVFKNEIGMSPVNFVNQARIQKATAMLSDPNIKIKEVFLACGYNNMSYFNRMFKKVHGISPKCYQQKQMRL